MPLLVFQLTNKGMIELEQHHFKVPNKLKDLGIYEWLFTSQKTIRYYVPPDPDIQEYTTTYEVVFKGGGQ